MSIRHLSKVRQLTQRIDKLSNYREHRDKSSMPALIIPYTFHKDDSEEFQDEIVRQYCQREGIDREDHGWTVIFLSPHVSERGWD